ncbi:putative secreted protein [Corynebacterium pilosum]|uniref:Putative secreted protein n=2 Tax=Corynebacterium pilosum TaxID=35756 RepID=A0A376CN65_9CORY|nr:putative secreted protein [Corynebacterium pilosum]
MMSLKPGRPLLTSAGLVLVLTLGSACTIGNVDVPGSEGTAQDGTVTMTSTTTIPPEESPPPPPAELSSYALQGIVDEVIARYGGNASVAVSDGTNELVGGDDAALPAWSTIKVPIAIAALRQDPSLAPTAAAAIQSSDNAAAEVLWSSVTPPLVEAVLAEAEAPTSVNAIPTRPGVSTFGQTPWSPSQQARFVANLACVDGAQPVLDLMGQIVPEQSYGIGQLPRARFKGGWGPDTSGLYDIRQFGRFSTAQGDVAVALTASPADGSYATAQAMANELAQGLSTIAHEFPLAACQ